MLIDCGGIVDLAEFLSLSVNLTVYLIDSHRPHSLMNIFNNSQVSISKSELLFDG